MSTFDTIASAVISSRVERDEKKAPEKEKARIKPRPKLPNYKCSYCTVRLNVPACCACGCVASVTVTVIADVPGGVGVLILTVPFPDLVESACALAVTVTAPAGTATGAAYIPFVSTVPFAAPPATAQVTPWFEELCTVAVNCCVCGGAPLRLG